MLKAFLWHLKFLGCFYMTDARKNGKVHSRNLRKVLTCKCKKC
uniref:Uncharacterized protein n=1 Tax=Rhizophora mucronata TaxID=61149 RepID=A0A2P2NDC7_RHIMU